MLCPGVKDIFGVFSCGSSAMKECLKDDGTVFVDITEISVSSWCLSIGMAALVIVLHLLGRWFIRLPLEFKLNPKKI